MSYGIKPYDFVQQVYYVQEKVLLDFHPDDDKYKEVMTEANLVLQELQKEEDWLWLRERLVLGPCGGKPGIIPEFKMPEWVYKPSQLLKDGVRLHRAHHHHHHHHDEPIIDEWDYITVPWVSGGAIHRHKIDPVTWVGAAQVRNIDLGAVSYGGLVTFNRPLFPGEASRIAVTDVQRRITQIHVCDKNCEKDENGVCTQIEDRILCEVPDPNYVIYRTAALHAQGSPPAQARAMDIADTAQKLLSAMRANDTASTDSDFLEWDPLGYINVF